MSSPTSAVVVGGGFGGLSTACYLADAGVDSVPALAAGDAADIASRIDVSEKRVQRWIDRASER